MPEQTTFDWNELAFGSKKPVNALDATFIVAPREFSAARLKQLIKAYLPKGNIILGLAKEAFVDGLEDQPQFRMLRSEAVTKVIEQVNTASPRAKIYTLHYFQRDLVYILEKLSFAHVVLVNGSWKYSFHTQPPYYVLARRKISYEMVSPFADESEAHDYTKRISNEIATLLPISTGRYSAKEMLELANRAASYSFDHTFQTGATLGRKKGSKYELLAWAYNAVVPYQAHALHHGASREQNFSPPNDLNHYDTIHAEMQLLVAAAQQGVSLKGTTLFINLLPCPTCARVLCQTDLAEIIYSHDHSAGYALSLLEATGKHVTAAV